MFKRRTPLTTRQKITESIWPSMGWKRMALYWRHRIFRTGDSTYKITAGLAVGAAISFSPFVGTHLAQVFVLTWMLRASFLAGFIGTALGNPATLPFIFWIAYHVGTTVLSAFGVEDKFALPDNFTLAELFHHPLTLLAPLTIGGYSCGMVAGAGFYLLLFYPVRLMRRLYHPDRPSLRRKKMRSSLPGGTP